ncbi:hypothetical protein QBC38DRAFT_383074, partial [Podospora fimiseda]
MPSFKLFLSSLTALLTSVAPIFAQSLVSFNQTGPFLLKVTSASNTSLNDLYISTCRAGAAIEGLCLGDHAVDNNTWNFFWNYTVFDGVPSETGILTWTLPVVGANILTVSEALSLNYNPGSNVVLPLFTPGQGTSVGWDDNTLYIPGLYDDALFQPNQYPDPVALASANNQLLLKNWYACWIYFGAYYFHAIAWVSAGLPHNPTCEPVMLEK